MQKVIFNMEDGLSLPSKKLIFVFIVFLVVGASLGIYKNKQTELVDVYVGIPSGIDVSIHQDLGGDGTHNYDIDGQPVESISSSQEISLKRGLYSFVINDSSNIYDVSVFRKQIDFGTKNVELSPSYTAAKLDEMLPNIRASALSSFYGLFPLAKENYYIWKDSAYKMGDWYGAVLKPKSAGLDTYRIIMKAERNSWKLAINRPLISIGIPSFPDIPPEVISEVDKL